MATPPMHRGRLQAQGPGTEESEPWTQDSPPTKSEMLASLDRLWDKLTPQEQQDRVSCFADARRFVQQAPAAGISAVCMKSFRNRRLRGGVRVDLEVRAGSACVDDRP